MNNRQFRSLCRYILDVAVQFGLRDWDFDIHLTGAGSAEDGSDAIANVQCVYGRKVAHINIDPSFLNADPEEQRQVICHELVHVHLWQQHDLLCTTVEPLVGKIAWNSMRPAINLVNEHATDSLAAAIAPSVPLWEG